MSLAGTDVAVETPTSRFPASIYAAYSTCANEAGM
jgi:hypothetical protein